MISVDEHDKDLEVGLMILYFLPVRVDVKEQLILSLHVKHRERKQGPIVSLSCFFVWPCVLISSIVLSCFLVLPPLFAGGCEIFKKLGAKILVKCCHDVA